MKYTQVAADVFEKLQLNAGVLLTEFDPATGTLDKTKIFAATSGGNTFTATPEISDFGEDIDNVPANTKELMRIESYTVELTGTAKTADADTVKRLIAAADVASGKITPRHEVKTEDFDTIWWVGDYGDVNTGDHAGYIAIEMLNAISTGGFSLKSNDKGKADLAFTFRAFYSIESVDTVPFNVYVKEGA